MRLEEVKVQLDRTWDLLRRRRAREEFGLSPGRRAGQHRRDRRALPAVSTGGRDGLRRAADEIRTRDPQLGKLMLYQLSYRRTRG